MFAFLLRKSPERLGMIQDELHIVGLILDFLSFVWGYRGDDSDRVRVSNLYSVQCFSRRLIVSIAISIRLQVNCANSNLVSSPY